MKSSNNLIRSNTNASQIKGWNPQDFNNISVDTKEFVPSDAAKFFGLEITEQAFSKRNLIRSTESYVDFQTWLPSEIVMEQRTNQDENIIEWTPFIEKPNPQKIADKIIIDAKEEANLILEKANNEALKIKQDAYNAGAQSIHSEMSESLKAAASVINVAREWREDLMHQAESMVLDLVKKIAQTMFGNGLVLENEVLQSHFSEILESARALGDLRIFMNPDDAKVLGPDWREYQSSIMGSKVEIISNESIKRGGCYIQGEWGTADALVETQLNAILEQFSEVEIPVEGDD